MKVIDFSDVEEFINPIYRKYLYDMRYMQIFKGGASAGKSYFVAQKLIYNFMVHPGYNVLCVRKVGATNHDSTFAELIKTINEFGVSPLLKVNKAKGQEEIYNTHNGNKIIFRGLDDPEKIKSITFSNGMLIAIWVEEASEATEDDISILHFRLRGKSSLNKHMILSFNPISKSHWLKRRFFDIRMSKEEGFICETTYKNNRYLTDGDRERIESYKDIDWYYYMVYALNEWGDRTDTAVFSNIEVHDFDIPEYMYGSIHYGMDFGYNDPNVLVGVGIIDKEIYIFCEIYVRKKLNSEFIKIIEEGGFEKDYWIVADCARPEYIEEFNNRGFLVEGSRKGKESIRIGVEYMKALPKIHIHKKRCPNSAREFLDYKYKQLRDGTIDDKEFVDLDNHTVDAVRYAMEEYSLGDNAKPIFTKGAHKSAV